MTTAAGSTGAVANPAGTPSPEIANATAAAAAALAGLQRRWPSAVELGIATQASIYHGYPYLFLGAFPALTAARVEPLSLAASLIFDSLFVADDLMDEDPTDRDTTVNVLRVQAMQFEGYQILHGLFPPTARFWDRCRDYLTLYAEACVDERLLALPAGDWTTLTRSAALRIAKGKCSLAKLAVAGLAELAGDDRPYQPLTRALDRYYIARQMVDDLSDWRQDLARGYPSLLLARVAAAEFGAEGRAGLARQPERVLQALYFGGHARATIEIALAALAEVDELIAGLPDMLWRGVLARLRAQCRGLLAELDRITGAAPHPAGHARRFELVLPPPAGPWQETAWTALGTLLERWRPRPEPVPPTAAAPRWHRAAPAGDLLARALVADALCEADQALEGQLRPLIEGEARFFLDHRRRAGGWGWTAVSPGLPADADHLGMVLRVFLRLGWREAVEEHCVPALDRLLAAAAGGAPPTWIAGTGEPAPPGGGPDEAVVAHLLGALALDGRERFASTLARGACWLEGRQQEEGSWQSPGYRGPYLPTAAALGLLAAVRPAAPALGRGAAFLRRSQRADGSWGSPLDTALALLGLAAAQDAAGEDADGERARRGRERLPASPPAGGGRLTAAFTLHAALAWHRRDAAAGRTP